MDVTTQNRLELVTKSFTVFAPDIEAIDRIAAENLSNRSQVVREAIREYVRSRAGVRAKAKAAA